MRRSVLAIVLLALAGCDHGQCARKSDCAAGETCTVDGVCERVVDGGVDDASGGDGGDASGGDASNDDAPTDGG
jgi:hypothetical protein